jgi:hypothetical protein
MMMMIETSDAKAKVYRQVDAAESQLRAYPYLSLCSVANHSQPSVAAPKQTIGSTTYLGLFIGHYLAGAFGRFTNQEC